MDNNTENTILKDPVLLHPDTDYDFLRKTGLAYIEELGAKLWTDYNEHDPGITILEALCYAITELGYRCSLPMADKLTNENGEVEEGQVLYTAREILTQAPLTENDYRKLLVDITGVQNAWLLYGDYDATTNTLTPIPTKLKLYADCKKDQLSTTPTPHPVNLFGLYNVLLDLETDAQFGDLNNGTLQADNPKTTSFAAAVASLSFDFPSWKEMAINDPAIFDIPIQDLSVCVLSFDPADPDKWNVKMSLTCNSVVHEVDGSVSVDLQPAGAELTRDNVDGFLNNDGFGNMIGGLYLMKIQKAKKIVNECKRTLIANRNLCEDFLSITTVDDEEISICCDIDIAANTDMEDVQAKVFLAIEEYLNPPIRFYLLNEMIDTYSLDEIFEGPKLTHGFINTDELEKTVLREVIHASDIISTIMSISGVLSVRNFRMTNNDTVPAQTGREWCMSITKGRKPILSETKSKIVFYKNKFPYLSSVKETRDIIRWLKSLQARNKLNGCQDDLPVTPGKYFPLNNYRSIQTLFPVTYGIGEGGLSDNASDERKAQARQLQAYLLFYDQLLADFFMQLHDAKDLFSIKKLTQTYSAQYINDIQGMDALYKKSGTDDLLQALMIEKNSDNNQLPPSEWQELYESNETYVDRRNRFLDHLMARFAESFNDYAFLMYSLDYDTQQETKIDSTDLINNKVDFLKNYPSISYGRGLAFNYHPEKFDASKNDFVLDKAELWDTDNVSGLEKKLCMLGAFQSPAVQSYYRRFLYCLGNITTIAGIIDPAKLRFVFTAGSNTLTSVNEYAGLHEINAVLPAFLSLAMAETAYCTKREGNGIAIPFTWNIYITDADCKALAKSNAFNSLEEAKKGIKDFVAEFLNECDNEGLHLIEHILLRPRNEHFDLAPVCLDPSCDFCGEQDPYSFKMSIVLPYWPAHFRNMAFRDYFENLARAETPAHIMVKVCWVDDEDLCAFEFAYKKWIYALATHRANPKNILQEGKLKVANNNLLTLLFKLHSKYPVALLHNCDESEDTNPVMLGRTALGSFKN